MELIGLQTDIAWHDRGANHARVITMLDEARPSPGSLVVLPEMFASGFSTNVAAATDGAAETEGFLSQLAKKHGVSVMAGIATRQDHCAGNESVVFGPDGSELVRYRKLHPFSRVAEGEAYPAGNRIITFQWSGFTVAPFICYDLRFPEIFREATSRGADLFAVVANWPCQRHDHWTTLLRARAIENLAMVIGVNRSGTDPNFIYHGGSAILGPQAEPLATAGKDPGVIRAGVKAETVAEWRACFPALRDRRSDISHL